MISAIVTAHNEGNNSLSVINTLLSVQAIQDIIYVDDGSTDEIWKIVENKYPQVKVLRLEKNVGKSQAVSEGLTYCKNSTILLMDSDLKGLKSNEIMKSIDIFLSDDKDIDMLILENKGGNGWIDQFINKISFFLDKEFFLSQI